MNKMIIMGRLTRDAEVRYSAQGNAVARSSVAVDRRFKRDGEPTADFINIVAFGKTAEFLEKYGNKGVKFAIEGRVQTGSYENKDGVKIPTFDLIVETIEFAESKGSQGNAPSEPKADENGFLNLPEGLEDLPFK